MDNLSLFTLLLACATFLLAIAAFLTIWLGHVNRRKDNDFKIKTEALNDIRQWLLDILNSTTLYLAAIRSNNEKEAFITKRRCDDILLKGVEMIVASGVFGLDFVGIIEKVNYASSALQDSWDNKNINLNNKEKTVEDFSNAICSAVREVMKKKMELLPEYFHNKK